MRIGAIDTREIYEGEWTKEFWRFDSVVSDKGVPAALLSAFVRLALKLLICSV